MVALHQHIQSVAALKTAIAITRHDGQRDAVTTRRWPRCWWPTLWPAIRQSCHSRNSSIEGKKEEPATLPATLQRARGRREMVDVVVVAVAVAVHGCGCGCGCI